MRIISSKAGYAAQQERQRIQRKLANLSKLLEHELSELTYEGLSEIGQKRVFAIQEAFTKFKNQVNGEDVS